MSFTELDPILDLIHPLPSLSRKPHPEEVPYLPYNIHYTIESSDGASDGSEYEHGEERTDQTQSDRRLLETPTGWSSTTTPTLCSSTAMTAGNCLLSGNFIEQITVNQSIN